MQRLFSQDIRFTQIDGTSFPDWEKRKLSELLHEHKKRNGDLQFRKKDVLSVSGDIGIVNQIDHLGRSYAGKSVANYHIVRHKDIVYTKSPLKANPYGIIKSNKGVAGIVSTLYAVYTCTKLACSDYLDYYFSLDDNVNKYLRPLVHKGAKNDMKVNNQQVLSGSIILPSISEQQKIAEFLSFCDKEIELLKQKLNALQQQRKGLLQRLSTGQTRVRVEEEVAVATIEVPTHNIEWNLNILAKLNGIVPVETRLSGSEPVYQSQPIHHLVEYLRTKLKINRLTISGDVSWDVVDGRRQIEVNLTIETFTEAGKEKEELVSFLERNIPKVIPKYIKMNSPQEETDLMEQLFRLRRDLHEV